jgi:hypothetical protein
MVLNTIPKIEYDSVFEVAKAHRMLEKLDGIKRERDHVRGVLKFEVSDKEHDFLKRNGIGFDVLD